MAASGKGEAAEAALQSESSLLDALAEWLNGTAGDWRRVLLILAALSFAVYFNALPNAFVLDDNILIPSDPRVTQQKYVELLTTQYWPPPGGNDLYRPVASVSFALNWAIAPQPWAFRFVNLVLYVACAFILFALVRDIGKSPAAALIAAVIWVVHPIHTYSMNSVIDRAELLAFAFGLAAVWFAWRDLSEGQFRATTPLLILVCFAMAVFSKENALSMVGVIIAAELFARASGRGVKPTLHRVISCYLPIVVVTVAYFLIRVSVLGTATRETSKINFVDNTLVGVSQVLKTDQSGTLARIATPVAVFGKAVGLLIAPTKLSWDYSYNAIPLVTSLNDGRLLTGGLAIAGLVALAVWAWRSRHPAFMAVALFLVTWSIVSNTYVLIGTLFGERFLFLPSAGWCMLIGVVAVGLMQRARARMLPGGTMIGLLTIAILGASTIWFGVLTVSRNRDYADDRTLSARDVLSYPQSNRLLASVATNALNEKDFQTAIDLSKRSTLITTENPQSWRVLGFALYSVGRRDEALDALTEAAKRGMQDEQITATMVDIVMRRGKYDLAIRVLEDSIVHSPNSPVLKNNLAWYYLTAEPATLRNPARAVELAGQAVAAQPTAGDFADTYAAALRAAGRDSEALAEIEKALKRIPANDKNRSGLEKQRDELRGGTRP